MSNSELESLKLAIKTEEDGHAMYASAAEKVSNPLAKAVFTQLAKEEMMHIEIIKRFYENLKQGARAQMEEIINRALDYDLRKKTIFEAAKSRMTKAVKSDPATPEAYRTALKFEEDGANMYNQLSTDTADPVAKKLYRFLNMQENEHFHLLQEGLNYLENPHQWFIETEKPHFEG